MIPFCNSPELPTHIWSSDALQTEPLDFSSRGFLFQKNIDICEIMMYTIIIVIITKWVSICE